MTKEIKIGLVGIVALTALFLGINFLKGKQLFKSQKTYYVSFTNVKGLTKSSQVYADGYAIGTVTDIIYDYEHPGHVLVEIDVDPKLVLRHGSELSLDTKLMGGCNLCINPALKGDGIFHEGDTIAGWEGASLSQQASDMMPQIRHLIMRLDTLIVSLNKVATDPAIHEILANAQQVSSDLTVTTSQLNTTLATVNSRMPHMLDTYTKVGENAVAITDRFKGYDLQPTIDKVNTTVSNVNAMITRMQSNEGTLGALINDRSMYNNINHTVQSADSLVTDIKAHPKRYVHFSVFGRKDK